MTYLPEDNMSRLQIQVINLFWCKEQLLILFLQLFGQVVQLLALHYNKIKLEDKYIFEAFSTKNTLLLYVCLQDSK